MIERLCARCGEEQTGPMPRDHPWTCPDCGFNMVLIVNGGSDE